VAKGFSPAKIAGPESFGNSLSVVESEANLDSLAPIVAARVHGVIQTSVIRGASSGPSN
jgi:hypothetical protein